MQQWVENFSQGTFSIACTFVRKYVFHTGCEQVQTGTSLRRTVALIEIDLCYNRSAVWTNLGAILIQKEF